MCIRDRYEAYERALQGGISLTLRYLKFLFLGPPRSGKTSTRRQLVQEIINLMSLGESSKSTGVAETNDVIIKKLVSEPAAISNSKWWSPKRSSTKSDIGQLDMYSERDLCYLAQLFYRLISTRTVPAASSEPVPDQASSDHSVSTAPLHTDVPPLTPDTEETNNILSQNMELEDDNEGQTFCDMLSDSEVMAIEKAFEKLTTILQSNSPEELQQLLEELTMINMIDVGGQPAFLEMLPALTIGPALYFLFFRLDQELRKQYRVRFLAADSEVETLLENSYSIEETLYQSLSSIACFGCHSPQECAESASKPQASSGALLFGTYKDQVDSVQISQMDKTLQERFTGTKPYEDGLLLKTLRGKIFFTVDNMFGTDESEMSDIRQDIEEIIKNNFPAIPIPASWLMFRILLHLLNKSVVSFAQCEEIAKRLSMPTPVEEALWFFHHNIGSLIIQGSS